MDFLQKKQNAGTWKRRNSPIITGHMPQEGESAMKGLWGSVVIALAVSSGVSHAGEPGIHHGVIQFVGSIVRAPCELSPGDWYQHLGRVKGVSPTHAGSVPAASGVCAGIADTTSISSRKVSSSSSVVQGELITITFN
jgi:type 1 fimbria pilin